MNILSKALDEIKYTIPGPILTEAFKDRSMAWVSNPTSLDDKIMTKIIRPRVLIDAKLVGGQTADISIAGIEPQVFDVYNMVFRIPKSRTGNKTIYSVLDVGFTPTNNIFAASSFGFSGIDPASVNNVNNISRRIGDASSSVPPITTADIEIIGENTILIKNMYSTTNAYYLRCILENDPNMSNISPRSYLAFSKLCQLAVKSYIYNNLIIRMDRAYIEGGQELGSFKSIVENYADAEEMYQTYLAEKWTKIALMNDTFAYNRLIKMQISPGL